MFGFGISTEQAMNRLLKSDDKTELTWMIKKIIKEKHLFVQEIPDPDKMMFRMAGDRLRQWMLDNKNIVIDNGYSELEKLAENSCTGCVFLVRNTHQDENQEMSFSFGCLYYNERIIDNTGALPINAQHLPLCTRRFLDSFDMTNVRFFNDD